MKEGVSKEWIVKAEEDLLAADTLLDSPDDKHPMLSAIIGFHSQQCIEKCLKAILTYNGIDFRRSHDLYYLVNLLEKEIKLDVIKDVRTRADMLNEFAVNTRYPGNYHEYDISESKEAFNLAKKVFEITEELLNHSQM